MSLEIYKGNAHFNARFQGRQRIQEGKQAQASKPVRYLIRRWLPQERRFSEMNRVNGARPWPGRATVPAGRFWEAKHL